ncbi:hypothetical protein IB286_13455 [Spongiibacter sp. KMU-158]|uniref:Uncharacterized protein n=1 Tax=Spongiibacter pelagi TaxID=2760804 RepID=A0A927C2C4_9GAMM|nr:hypothetical protein [Spongiibacter pelagi]MBD2860010.1 hypothetical protein [Spongiibacter pelagi]
MRTHSTLLFILFMLAILEPGIGNWLFEESNRSWYRFHILWGLLILFIFFNSLRQRKENEL